MQELSTEVDIGHGGFVNCTSQPASRVLDVVFVSHARFPPFSCVSIAFVTVVYIDAIYYGVANPEWVNANGGKVEGKN